MAGKALLALLVGLVTLAPVSARVDVITSIVAYYDLDEASGNAIDVHGSNDLTDTNTVGTTTGKIDTARAFVRANTEYFTSTTPIASAVPLTVNCWVNLTANNVNQVIASGGGTGSEAFAWGLAVTTGGKLQFYTAEAGGNFAFVTGGTTLSTSTFYMVSLVWRTSTDYEIYLNNASEGTGSTARTPGGTQNRWVIGAYHYAGTDSFGGAIDECGAWSADKTSDLDELYASGSGLAYPFDGGGGAASVVPAIINSPIRCCDLAEFFRPRRLR